MTDIAPASGEPVYQLPKSGLELQGSKLIRREGGTLIADHDLGDLREMVLQFRRTGGDWSGVFFFLFWTAGAAAGIVYWAHPNLSILGYVGFGFMGVIGLIGFFSLLTSKSAFLVVRTRQNEVSYPLADDPPVLEAFFGEIREHAEKERLHIDFRIER